MTFFLLTFFVHLSFRVYHLRDEVGLEEKNRLRLIVVCLHVTMGGCVGGFEYMGCEFTSASQSQDDRASYVISCYLLFYINS